MNIAILQDDFPPFEKGGAGLIAYSLAKGYQKAGHEVLVITTVQEKEYAGRGEFEGIPTIRIFSSYPERWRAYRSLYNPSTVKQVKSVLENFSPDVVHVHNVHQYLSYHSIFLAKKTGARVFLTAHDTMLFHYGKLDEFVTPGTRVCRAKHTYRVSAFSLIKKEGFYYNPFRNIIIRKYLTYSDAIIAVSDALLAALRENGIPVMGFIHNGIDIAAWIAPKASIDTFEERHGLRGNKIVLFGGRLGDAKGGGQMLKVMQSVLKKVPDAVLLVLGRIDTYGQTMMQNAERMGMKEHVIFAGWIGGEELKAAYATSDVVCVLSQYLDPFPTINLEAMAMGKPVVGTCLGGTPEAVEDGVTGMIVNPFDTPLIAEMLAKLLSNNELKAQYGERGRIHAREHFTSEKMTRAYLDHFGMS